MLREKRGITLIALVVTIIVLLILAAVSISAIAGENGIMTKAKKAQEETKNAQLEEELNLKLANVQIDMALEENIPFEAIGLKGLYRYQLTFGEKVRLELDGYFESSSGFSKALLVMEQGSDGVENMEFTNVKEVKEIPDMAIPLFKYMFSESQPTDIEIVDEESYGDTDITGVKYKNVIYDITETFNSRTGGLLTIAVREEFTAKKWKNVFIDEYLYNIYALDSNNKLWRLTSETSGVCLNNLYPEFNNIKIKDAIYSYDDDSQCLYGFIDESGDICFLNYDDYSDIGMIANVNEMFPEILGGIKAKKVIPLEGVSTSMEASQQARYWYTFYSSLVLDTDGKAWIIDFGWENDDEIGASARCINTSVSELASVSFNELIMSDLTSPNYEPKGSVDRYPTIIGLDSNKKVWKIQIDPNIPSYDSQIQYFDFSVKCVSDTESLPLIKSINYVYSKNSAVLLGEDNLLYMYYGFNYASDTEDISSSESSDVLNSLTINKTNGDLVLDTSGNLYTLDEYVYDNSESFEGNGIVEIYAYNWVLDEEGNIYDCDYGSFYSNTNLENTNLKNVSTSRRYFCAIDENDNLIISHIEYDE